VSKHPFTWVYLVCVAIASAIRAPYARKGRRGKSLKTRPLAMEIPLLVLAGVSMQILPLLYLLTSWLDFADYRLPGWTGYIGTAIFAVGLWLLRRSHTDLGDNFWVTVRIREEHALVTSGVYRKIRHPMYAAHLLWAAAQPLLMHNWLAGASFLPIMLLVLIVRVPREEKMMLEHFGDEYRQYMSRTGRIIPR
jgi:protein-S-isoprenylcysteine O-methyltransferase Ste14